MGKWLQCANWTVDKICVALEVNLWTRKLITPTEWWSLQGVPLYPGQKQPCGILVQGVGWGIESHQVVGWLLVGWGD